MYTGVRCKCQTNVDFLSVTCPFHNVLHKFNAELGLVTLMLFTIDLRLEPEPGVLVQCCIWIIVLLLFFFLLAS